MNREEFIALQRRINPEWVARYVDSRTNSADGSLAEPHQADTPQAAPAPEPASRPAELLAPGSIDAFEWYLRKHLPLITVVFMILQLFFMLKILKNNKL